MNGYWLSNAAYSLRFVRFLSLETPGRVVPFGINEDPHSHLRRCEGGAVKITLDRQMLTRNCQHCAVDFVVVRGSVFDAGQPIGLYLIALHGHSAEGRLAHLALALLEHDASEPPQAFAVEVTATPKQFGYSVANWSDSPWKDEAYLGVMLDRDAALASPRKATVFHVAGHVVRDLPEVQRYFAEEEAPSR
jgi:hypothetical protein